MHLSCMTTSLVGQVPFLQERRCVTGLVNPRKAWLRRQQQRDPTALCHETLQRASRLSRRAERGNMPKPTPREEFHY